MKRLAISLIILLLVGLPAGCGRSQREQAVKLGMLRIEDNLPFFVAEKDDLFAKKGVKVELVLFNSARERDMALEAGEIHGELADLVAAALLKKGRTPVKVVSLGLGATPAEGRFLILAAPKSNIKTPQDLKGIPIAISQHTIIHYLAEEMPREMGLKPEDIKLQNIPDMNIRLEALLEGNDVKAALLPDPLATLALESGAIPIIDDSKLAANLSQTVILFREEVLKDSPEAVKKILQCYQEAASLLNQDPSRYKELIVDKARIPKTLEDSYRIPRFSNLEMPTKPMVDRLMNWMADKKLLEKPYNYDELVTPGYLN